MGSSSNWRTTDRGLWVAHTPRTVSRSISCSASKSRSSTVSSSPSRLPPRAGAAPRVVVVVHRHGHAGVAGGLHVTAHGQGHVEPDPATAGIVYRDLVHHSGQDHGVAGKHRSEHAEGHPTQAAVGTGPDRKS